MIKDERYYELLEASHEIMRDYCQDCLEEIMCSECDGGLLRSFMEKYYEYEIRGRKDDA